MKITASQVKELRDRTGAGMMDCRKALVESEGNLDEAVEVLRKAGAAKAAKKAGRVAAEGLVGIGWLVDEKSSGMHRGDWLVSTSGPEGGAFIGRELRGESGGARGFAAFGCGWR